MSLVNEGDKQIRKCKYIKRFPCVLGIMTERELGGKEEEVEEEEELKPEES